MANKLAVNSLNNNVNYFILDTDPATDGVGFPAAIGSVAVFLNASGEGRTSIKVGSGDTDWVSENVYYGVGFERAVEAAEESTTSSTFVTKFSNTFTAPITANYQIMSYYMIRHSDRNTSRFAVTSDEYSLNGGAFVEFGSNSEILDQYKSGVSLLDIEMSANDTLQIRVSFREDNGGTAFIKSNRIFFFAESESLI